MNRRMIPISCVVVVFFYGIALQIGELHSLLGAHRYAFHLLGNPLSVTHIAVIQSQLHRVQDVFPRKTICLGPSIYAWTKTTSSASFCLVLRGFLQSFINVLLYPGVFQMRAHANEVETLHWCL